MELEFARARAATFEPFTLFRVPAMAGRYVNVTEQGYRLGKPGTPWPPAPGSANLFVFGGSTAFGFEVPDTETIPSQLADRLAELMPSQPVAVYNFGTPNYFSVQERIRLEQLLLEGNVPRVAVFIDGFDECIWPYYSPQMLAPFVDAIPRPSAFRLASATLRAVSRSLAPTALSRWLSASEADETSCRLPDPAVVVDRYLANKRLIEGICERFGVRPLLVWQPVPCYRYAGGTQSSQQEANRTRDRLLDCVQNCYELMSTWRSSQAVGDEFLWLADLQEGRSERLYVDADHYTAAFSGEIARAIADHIDTRGLIR